VYFEGLKKRTPPEDAPSGGAALIAGGNDEMAFAWETVWRRCSTPSLPSREGKTPDDSPDRCSDGERHPGRVKNC
jgi:hypothetical protein